MAGFFFFGISSFGPGFTGFLPLRPGPSCTSQTYHDCPPPEANWQPLPDLHWSKQNQPQQYHRGPPLDHLYNFLSKQGLAAIMGRQINNSPGAKVT